MPEILIIEDERPIAELLKYSLEREGYQVRRIPAPVAWRPLRQKRRISSCWI